MITLLTIHPVLIPSNEGLDGSYFAISKCMKFLAYVSIQYVLLIGLSPSISFAADDVSIITKAKEAPQSTSDRQFIISCSQQKVFRGLPYRIALNQCNEMLSQQKAIGDSLARCKEYAKKAVDPFMVRMLTAQCEIQTKTEIQADLQNAMDKMEEKSEENRNTLSLQ